MTSRLSGDLDRRVPVLAQVDMSQWKPNAVRIPGTLGAPKPVTIKADSEPNKASETKMSEVCPYCLGSGYLLGELVATECETCKGE